MGGETDRDRGEGKKKKRANMGKTHAERGKRGVPEGRKEVDKMTRVASSGRGRSRSIREGDEVGERKTDVGRERRKSGAIIRRGGLEALARENRRRLKGIL